MSAVANYGTAHQIFFCHSKDSEGSKHKNEFKMNFRQKILRYFKPKKFELYRNKTIYDLIGIRTYKKYLPTTGDIVRKRKNITQIKFGKTSKVNELYKYEKKTRNYEWRHLAGAVIFIFFTLLLDSRFSIFEWILLSMLNLYINIYPIFLQRFNRIRIIKILQNNELKSPYDDLA